MRGGTGSDGARQERTRPRPRWIALGVVAVVGTATVALAITRDDAERVAFAGDLRVGGRLEALKLPALVGGGTVDYASFEGRPLVINFFASWCPTCVAEMPHFEGVHERLGDSVVFLGISQRDRRQASIDLARETGITYDTALDERGAFFDALGAYGMPTTVFVGPGGEIAEIWAGPLDAETLERLTEEHLGVDA